MHSFTVEDTSDMNNSLRVLLEWQGGPSDDYGYCLQLHVFYFCPNDFSKSIRHFSKIFSGMVGLHLNLYPIEIFENLLPVASKCPFSSFRARFMHATPQKKLKIST